MPVPTDARHRLTRLLITAGPTHEPIDDVRYLGNRSSGRLGVALADEAARRGWTTTLLLGPTAVTPSDSRVAVRRFRTCAELQHLLDAEWPPADTLIMAAAVADYRPLPPATHPGEPPHKIRRADGPLTLTLEPTPDLLAHLAASRRPGQSIVGFALEPRETLFDAAADKLRRKGVDLIVANPLETMDSHDIDAIVLAREGPAIPPPGPMPKPAFARWLLSLIDARLRHAGPKPDVP
ncbi:MAG: phosphopantothenoylcysteine decarboxylase [Phycisphaeraceae bacterium]|nr:MAG: phosphopantothenoylcysteine decarboxylase [Phycisphaeraceae bacterium]